MCMPGLDPVTMMMIASTAATALGTQQQIAGQQASINAQADAQQAENIRQEQYRRNQERIQNQNLILDQRRNVREEDIVRNERKIRRADTKARQGEPMLKQALPGQGTQSRAVASSGARDAQTREANSQKIADAFARMGGFRRAEVNNAGTLQDAFSRMQQEGGFARGSIGVLPAEMRAAQNAGAGKQAVGNMLTGLGTLLSVGAGLYGGGPAIVQKGAVSGPFTGAAPLQAFSDIGPINPSQIIFSGPGIP